jgi:hypothetical protein
MEEDPDNRVEFEFPETSLSDWTPLFTQAQLDQVREDALEEAATVAESCGTEDIPCVPTVDNAAAAIRSLKGKKE